MSWCEICNVRLPANSIKQHLAGRRHNSMRFYGLPGGSVANIELRAADGTLVESIRPHMVPDRIVQPCMTARKGVLPRLVEHTGVAFFSKACELIQVESLCGAMLQLEKAWAKKATSAMVNQASAATILCAAQRLHSGDFESGVRLHLQTQATTRQISQMVLSAALHALAKALAECPRDLTISIDIGAALTERRLMALFVNRLCASLRSRTRTLSLSVSASGGHLRESDSRSLKAAARDGWGARAVALLLGTHPRVGAASPLRCLPTAILALVLEHAAADSRIQVNASASENQAQSSQANPAVLGDDLEFVQACV